MQRGARNFIRRTSLNHGRDPLKIRRCGEIHIRSWASCRSLVDTSLCGGLPHAFSCVCGCGDSGGLVAVISGQAPVAGPLFRFTEPMGPYAVGLKVVEQYDYSRTWRPKVDADGEADGGGAGAAAADADLVSGGEECDEADDGARIRRTAGYGDELRKPELSPDWKQWIDGMKPTLKDSLWAVRDAKAVAGKFPVVIYAPSFYRDVVGECGSV